MSILTNFARFINSDRYQYTESDVYLKQNMQRQFSVFNYFFRKSEDGGFAVVVGTHSALELLSMLNNTPASIKRDYFSFFNFDEELIEYLANLTFNGNVYAMQEGELAFANQPVFTVTGDLLASKILETPLLNSYNYQMAIASKASRITRAAGDLPVLAFGPRRAHGFDASVLGTRAALIGGCAHHSAMASEYFYGIPSVGSISHSFIQSFGLGAAAEYLAFCTYIARQKERNNPSIFLLIDTYDTVKCGLKNAIAAFKEQMINDNFQGIYGIRLDSGDLAYFSKVCRKELDAAGLYKAKILLTNSLNEHLISELKQQNAPFDMIGVGDAIATSKDNPCFGGVYKLVELEGQPLIKLSNDAIKITTPAHKNVYRIYQQGEARADLITLANNDPEVELLLAGKEITIRAEADPLKFTTFKAGSYSVELLTKPMMIKGELTQLGQQQKEVNHAKTHYQQQLRCFSPERTRIVNPHHYKVDLSTALHQVKYQLIHQLNKEIHNE